MNMRTKKAAPILLLVFGTLLLILAGCASPEAPAAPPTEAPPEAPTEAPAATQAPALAGNAVRGGLLYDKWWSVLELDKPTDDQPLWSTQTSNTRSGSDTWRCKECHGWDYKGQDGAYSSGSHFTGFPGVIDMAGMEPGEVLAKLQGSTNPDHDFSTVMDEQSLIDLAVFLSGALMDDSGLVNADKSLTSGDEAAGVAHYAVCSACHGTEGTAINFGDESDPEYLGTVAAGNPWEFLHKVRFGQPGVPEMPAGFTVDRPDEYYADLLALVQTMPTASAVTEGGRLYDKWWTAMGADEPEGDHPLWATQTTNERSGTDTWRCKECRLQRYLRSKRHVCR
jgi:thiosulfate dehydrogenase